MVRRYWLVAVVAVVGAVIAYAGSFAVSPTYESSTLILLRSRDTTLLTATGEPLRDQTFIADPTLTAALADTQVALLTSRRTAELVVQSLGLSDPTAQGNAYEETLNEVQSHLQARPLKESYVIEVIATASDPESAMSLANAAADALVSISEDRFTTESETYASFLNGQLDEAAAAEREAAEALQAFKSERGIRNFQLEVDQGLGDEDQLRDDLDQTELSLTSAQARLASIEASIDNLPDDIDSGVSEQLLVTKELTAAEIASLEARKAGLLEDLQAVPDSTLSQSETELRKLELDHAIASARYSHLVDLYQQALLNTQSNQAEITRVDQAALPLSPTSPHRIVFLALGLVAGLVIGFIGVVSLDLAAGLESAVPSTGHRVEAEVQREGEESRHREGWQIE